MQYIQVPFYLNRACPMPEEDVRQKIYEIRTRVHKNVEFSVNPSNTPGCVSISVYCDNEYMQQVLRGYLYVFNQ
jgi:hypothetical protein